MKYIFGTIVTLLIVILGFSFNVAAHSGNTDSSGGHTCWTNCSYWGYSYGEYHYHNGGYDYTDYYDQGSEAGFDFVDENYAYIVSRAESEGAEEGKTDGESGALESKSPNPDDTCSDVDFQDYSSPQDYYDGFIDSYSDGCQEVYEDKYSVAYEDAYATSYEIYETEIAAENNQGYADNSYNSTDWSGILVILAIIGIPLILIGNWENIKEW